MSKEIKNNLGFREFLENKNKYQPYSIDVSTIEEELVIGDQFDSMFEGVSEIGFKINDLDKEIKEYMGLLAFLNIVKTKNLINHSNIYVQVEYAGKESEEKLTRFYEKMNLWNVRMLIVPRDSTILEDYTKYISAFITKVLNKETLVSMEPTETLIKEKTNQIYAEIQQREVEFEDLDIVKLLIVDRIDFEKVRKDILISFKDKEIEEIRQMINTITKSIFDMAKQDGMIKTK